jgi:superfamily I DNA/RNA helicase
MIVIQTKRFSEAYTRHVETGAEFGRMARKASEVITNLTHGLPAGAPTSNRGENRLRNCVKYALNEGFRLVTVQDGSRCFVLFMGKHDTCDEWLVQNRNMQVVYDPKKDEVALVSSVKAATPDDLVPAPLDPAKTAFLKQLEDIDWPEVFPNSAHRFMLETLKEADGERIWETIAFVQQEDAKGADLFVTVMNHLRRKQPVEARLAVKKFMGAAVAEEPDSALPEKTLEEAIRQPVNRERFIVLNDLTPEELELVHDPNRFQDWMVFLHEGQSRVVDEDFEQPSVLTGVSGSGKTCVLVHRAKRLARKYPDGRILVLTLNRSLARLIENLISRLCSNSETERIDVLAFYDYLTNLLNSLDLETFLDTLGKCTNHTEAIEQLLSKFSPQRLQSLFQALDERHLYKQFNDFVHKETGAGTDAAIKLWNFLSTSEVNVDPIHYLYEEMELVRSAFSALSGYDAYLEDYQRPGRSVSFQRNRKEQVLGMLHAWETYQIRNGFMDHMGLSQAATVAVEDRGSIPNPFCYRSVLVDEFQDFSTLDLQLLQKIPKESENGLFLTGDLAQKIFAKELNFPKAEMGPKQRALRSIRKNYRNSRQILLAADSLIKAFPPPQDGDQELKVLDPELASRNSAKPIAIKTETPIQEAWSHAKDWIAEGNPGFSVCIATANPNEVSLDEVLAAAPKGVVAVPLSGDYMLNPTSVVVSDMANIKGFEFSLIVIVGLEDGVYPFAKRPRAEIWRDAMRLYVAITRGRDEVRFAYEKEPSEFLVAMEDHVDWRKAAPIQSEVESSGASTSAAGPKEASTVDSTTDAQPEAGSEAATASEPANAAPKVEEVPQIDSEQESEPVLVEKQGADAKQTPIRRLVFLNGYPCLSVPHGITERELCDILDYDSERDQECVQVSLDIQSLGVFLSPVDPLPDHAVKHVLDKRRILVSFLND